MQSFIFRQASSLKLNVQIITIRLFAKVIETNLNNLTELTISLNHR
ncbi:hypothetical protein [Shewanella ulleungensis]|nr:hypothetical protein [Shewanella ulleungensis]MCL1149044.1 hypothetical protein [Shewanella ulleungensis]